MEPGAVPSVWTLGGVCRIGFMSRVIRSWCTGPTETRTHKYTNTGYICITAPTPPTHNANTIKKASVFQKN